MKRAGSCSASDRQRDAVRLSSFSLSLHVGSDKPREGEGKGRKPSLGRLVKAGALRSSFTSLEIDEPATSRHIGSPERGGKDVFVGATSAVRQSFSPTRNFNQVVSRTLERVRPIGVRRDDLRRPSPSTCPARNSPSGRCHVNVGTRSRRTPGRHGETDQQHPQQPTSQRRDLSLRLEPFRGSAVLPHQLLERVSIEGCGLVSIPPPVMSLKHLTYLDVSWNGIRSLPSNIRIMKALVVLDVSFNRLTHVPEDIGRLTQLQTLKVGDNFLYRLPSTLDFHFFRLSQLHAQYNDLSRVPRQIFNIPSLTYLDLRGNSKLPGMMLQASTSTADVVRALKGEEEDAAAQASSDAILVRKLIRDMRPNLLGLYNQINAELEDGDI